MKRRHRRRAAFAPTAAALIAGALLLAACREVPPELPGPNDRPDWPQGWPPPAVYAPDPLHPANRWFQRVHLVEAEGSGRVATEAPQALIERYDPLDRAEVKTLLGAIAKEGLPPAAPPLLRRILRADLLAEAERVRELEGPSPLFLAYAAALDALVPAAETTLELALPETVVAPPPLRQGTWREADPPDAPGLVPSPWDLRESRVLERSAGDDAGGPPARALLRVPLEIGPQGDVEPLPVPGEVRLLEPRDGRLEPRLFRFDRARYLRGEDPWREVGAAETVELRDPTAPEAPLLRGRLRELCLSCHGERSGR